MLNTKLRYLSFFTALTALAASGAALNAQTVRFQTSLGGIDVVLTPSITPITVTNFMTYVNSGAYNNTIVHRSLSPTPTAAEIAAGTSPTPPYVIQGGGYALGPGNLPILIPQNAQITSEFTNLTCPCNVAGTLAMALYGSSTSATGTNISSATDEWYFNASDNSSYFDGGDYTVFGNVANDASLAVVNAINVLLTWSVNFGQDATFSNLPLLSNYTCPNASACPRISPANYVFVNSIAPIAPVVTAAGVVDAATALASSSTGISPGQIITLYGQNFSQNPPVPSYLGPTQGTTLTLDPTGSFVTTSLEGTQVLFNGVAGPMIYSSDQQISVVVPYGIAGQRTVSVVVSYLGVQTSNPMTFNVVPANPGLFTLNQTGKGDAAIVHPDGSGVSTASPASPGDILELYGEGYGVASPSTTLPDGALAGSTLPLPAATTVLLIDGQTVIPAYAGAAPGDVNGVMQINFQVPQQLKPGSHQIQLKVGNAVSPTGVNLQTK